jgi:UrcA family protein
MKEWSMNPKLTLSSKSAAVLILAMAGLVTNTDLAMAQGASEEQISEESPEVIVVAPKEDTIGFRTVTDKLSRPVNYADLDLTKHADVIELENRIETTAKEVCKELNAADTEMGRSRFPALREKCDSQHRETGRCSYRGCKLIEGNLPF